MMAMAQAKNHRGRRERQTRNTTASSTVRAENIAFLTAAVSDRRTGWSMGSFGAIAEFHTDVEEILTFDRPQKLLVASSRGAMALKPQIMGKITPIAYETLVPNPRRWSHGIALCLDRETANRDSRTTLTELGSDHDAIREENREEILFDLGLGLPQADFCIRTDDAELIDILCACEGRSLFDSENPATVEILHRHPHRVILTNIGRMEVFQKIGGPETGGVSPVGPHTHLLPKLLRSGRTHSANIPIPPGLIPCGYVHPPNPVAGPLGEDIPFDQEAHEAFQSVLLAFGPSGQIEVKERLRAAIEVGVEPQDYVVPTGRHGRMACRILLRQLRRLYESRNESDALALLAKWEALFETRAHNASSDEDEPYAH